MARWIIHVSMCFTWIYALMGAATAVRPVEVLAACIFIVLVPFVYVAMIEEVEQ